MNSKIYLIPVIVFGMFLSIILGLQSQWGDITVISSVIVLFLSVLVLGYVLNEFFQRYNKKEVLQQRYYDEYIKSLDSIKLENIKIVERLDDDIKQYLGKNNECINELLDIVKLLSNVIQEMNNEMILLNKKVDNEFIKIKNIARILEEIEDNLDEKEIIVKILWMK